MSKHNVNPNHYKVAGRLRQGEDIAQERNKQKHAESLVRQRTEVGAKSRKPVPQKASASPADGPARPAKKAAARKTRATPPPAEKRAQKRVSGSTAPRAKRPKAASGVTPRSKAAAPPLNAGQAKKLASVNLQGADKRGKRSTAQKRASSRHEFDPMPATKAVAGAFGKEPSPRRRSTRKK